MTQSHSDDIHTLPTLLHRPTKAHSSRHGVKPTLITLHRWAGGTFESVVEMFINSPLDQNGKSSHFVYAGEKGRDAGKLAQMVNIADKAWTQAAWNPHCISIECADAIWVGDDEGGLARLGRIVGGLCHYQGIKPRWVTSTLLHDPNGFTRHHDLGVLGGNHPNCPTLDVKRWTRFMGYVHTEFDRGGYRSRQDWGLR